MSDWNFEEWIDKLGRHFKSVSLTKEQAEEVRRIIMPTFIVTGVKFT